MISRLVGAGTTGANGARAARADGARSARAVAAARDTAGNGVGHVDGGRGVAGAAVRPDTAAEEAEEGEKDDEALLVAGLGGDLGRANGGGGYNGDHGWGGCERGYSLEVAAKDLPTTATRKNLTESCIVKECCVVWLGLLAKQCKVLWRRKESRRTWVRIKEVPSSSTFIPCGQVFDGPTWRRTTCRHGRAAGSSGIAGSREFLASE